MRTLGAAPSSFSFCRFCCRSCKQNKVASAAAAVAWSALTNTVVWESAAPASRQASCLEARHTSLTSVQTAYVIQVHCCAWHAPYTQQDVLYTRGALRKGCYAQRLLCTRGTALAWYCATSLLFSAASMGMSRPRLDDSPALYATWPMNEEDRGVIKRGAGGTGMSRPRLDDSPAWHATWPIVQKGEEGGGRRQVVNT